MQNIAKTNQVAVVSTSALAGGIPSAFVLGFGNSIPSASFKAAAGGVPVVLSNLAAYTSNAGEPGVSVLATDEAGHSQTFIALFKGFPGGRGGAESVAFGKALVAAIDSGSPVYLGVAGNSGRHFCALSESPFGGSAGAAPASDQILF